MHPPILDVCCGGRMFWFDKQNPNVLFADCRSEEVTFKDRNSLRKLEIKPDVIHDFTNMPYPDKSFKLVIFDPSHLIQGGDNSWLVKKYGRLNKDWQAQLKQGFDECMRVLDDFGTLIFKWNETQIPVSKILETINYQPLIGHKSGKAANTHWLLFIKLKQEDLQND
ncbi:class I SAM-dependent methyltransferase [Ursidibacter arcticus]